MSTWTDEIKSPSINGESSDSKVNQVVINDMNDLNETESGGNDENNVNVANKTTDFVASSKFQLNKIGELFKNRLKSRLSTSGHQSSVIHECEIHENFNSVDEESVSTISLSENLVKNIGQAEVINEKLVKTNNSVKAGNIEGFTLPRVILKQTGVNVNANYDDNKNNGEDTGFGHQQCCDDVVGKAGCARIISSSHYSTEKSGSSGYYSTNLYSTGSVDEHIYCEPVIECIAKVATTNSTPKNPSNQQCDNENDMKNLHKSITGQENFYFQPKLKDEKSAGHLAKSREKRNELLSIIMEGIDGQIPRPIWPHDFDDSLMDINLDSFRLKSGENNYHDLIGLESPATSNSDNEGYTNGMLPQMIDPAQMRRRKSQYEEYLDFHNTRNILEQIRSKLNHLLEQRSANQSTQSNSSTNPFVENQNTETDLEKNIAVLKLDLDNYLKLMNLKNENEIRQLCAGLSNDRKMNTVQNAIEQKNRSRSNSVSLEHEYEVLDRPSFYQDMASKASNLRMSNYQADVHVPTEPQSQFETVYVKDGFSLSQKGSIAHSMRTRSSTTVHRRNENIYLTSEECKVNKSFGDCANKNTIITMEDEGSSGDENLNPNKSKSDINNVSNLKSDLSQMQHNLTLQRIILMESLSKNKPNYGASDKEKMLLEWHQNKPSMWELYYGPNREENKPHQTLIRKIKIGRKHATSVAYPSTRPESDFTLDVPRAEQLRVKMKKEKQFRSRCRWCFYLLSVVFFLLTVMIVSMILTRGKRMFGSMI